MPVFNKEPIELKGKVVGYIEQRTNRVVIEIGGLRFKARKQESPQMAHIAYRSIVHYTKNAVNAKNPEDFPTLVFVGATPITKRSFSVRVVSETHAEVLNEGNAGLYLPAIRNGETVSLEELHKIHKKEKYYIN